MQLHKKNNLQQFSQIIIAISIAHSIGYIGNIATATSVDMWYEVLSKPSFNPPSWVFAPVWFILYTLMGYSSYLIYKSKHKLRTIALSLYATQLFLNALWSIIFFGIQNIQLAFLEIIALLVIIIINAYYNYKINKTAAYLYIPYIVWVSFATFLTYNILVLNT